MVRAVAEEHGRAAAAAAVELDRGEAEDGALPPRRDVVEREEQDHALEVQRETQLELVRELRPRLAVLHGPERLARERSRLEPAPRPAVRGRLAVERRVRGGKRARLADGERLGEDELRADHGIAVYPIVTVREILAFLHNREIDGRVYIDDAMKARMEAYLAEYGPRA